ncbi:helix-turn-helix domain-containing protein [Fusibacter sp. JL298sf-3]
MAYAGQTAFSYLKELRLLRGWQLLLQTDRTVTEIAGEVGWENPSKFSSAFKSRYKISPLTYRKLNKVD